ncbi:MAG: ATP-binding protein [Deltaproteobacteria bacterium]|nr:ATP-binding protein [Deltaproteobacteria bacterium]
MRFIVGPRQVGKTFLAREFLKSVRCDSLYFNWDTRPIRAAYRQDPHFFIKEIYNRPEIPRPWFCFDEIHKMPRWKNLLKDFFDSYEDRCRFIVTGSAKLDMMRYTGESLLGRYFTFRLYPLRWTECLGRPIQDKQIPQDSLQFIEQCLAGKEPAHGELKQLLECGGFPEPFLAGTKTFIRKWQHDYLDRFIKEDLRDLTRILEVENVFQLVEILPSKVGNPLSLNALREDMEVSHTAIRNWLRALTLTHLIFFLRPYSKRIARTVKKESKCYFMDWSRIREPGARFENFVAAELQAFCSSLSDSGYGDYHLHFFRTKEGNESDFLIVREGRPWLLLEAKLQETQIASHHRLHASLLGDIPFVQLVQASDALRVEEKKHFVISADRFLANLPS